MSKKKKPNGEVLFDLNLLIFKKIQIEWIFLLIFIIVLFNFMSVYNSGLLKHDNGPTNYLANDMFAFAIFADLAKYEEDVTKQPDYMSAGKTDAVNFFSMQGAYIAAQLSDFTGIETYDFIIHLNLLFIVLSIFIIFQFLKKIDTRLAYFSLPLSLLIFKWPFMYTITWGMHISNVNMLFIVTSLLCLYYLDKKYVFIALGIMNGAGVLAHAREFLMFNLGIALFFGVRMLREGAFLEILKKPFYLKEYMMKKETGILLRNYIISIPITLIFMFRHLPVLDEIYDSGSAARLYDANPFIQWLPPTASHHVYFHQFGFFEYLILVGTLVALYLLIMKKDKKLDIITTFALIFLISGFFSLLGNKTSQVRHIFPILMMPLVGFTLLFCYDIVKQLIKLNQKIIFSILFSILLVPTYAFHQPNSVSEYAFSDPYTWAGLKWVRDNVEEDAYVLTLYGDRHTQTRMFQLMRKIHFTTPQKEYLEKVSSANLTSTHLTRWGLVHFYMRQPNFHDLERVDTQGLNLKFSNESLCNFDYIYTDKVSRSTQVQSYTLLLINKLITESNFTPVFENELVLVLKNNNPGGECFEDEVLV